MAFSVFIHRADSIYDDSPAEQYQFPKQYLERVRASIGDWIIYLEPSKVANTRGYFGVARVQDVIPDPTVEAMYLAIIEPGSFLEFSNHVPFRETAGPVERGLLNKHGLLSGRAQSAVRPISPEDFSRIIGYGLDESDVTLPREDVTPLRGGDVSPLTGFSDPQVAFSGPVSQERIQQLTSRTVRDRAFRKIIIRAYDGRCAVTGLKFINGGGRMEVDAAHIKPVQFNGPDIVNNGIALSGTAHWMFDRGLVSLADDMTILVSRHVNDVDGMLRFINDSGVAILPKRATERPHPHFLEWHRTHCFKN